MNQAKLCLQAGGKIATMEEIARVPVPVKTASYTPLAHESFVSRVMKQLAVEGFTVTSQSHALAKDGARYFGLLMVALAGLVSPVNYGFVIGLRNSHDKKFPAGFVIGSQVFVCDNLAFSGEITVVRRHTPNLLHDLGGMILSAIARMPELFKKQHKAFEDYQNATLRSAQAHDLVVQLLDKGVINVTDIPRVLAEFRTPKHAEFNGQTAWSLYNATTEVLKGSNVWDLPSKTRDLHNVIDLELGRDIIIT